MQYTGKDALQFLYILLGQHGVSRAIGRNNFLTLLNTGINHIYNYEGYYWSWQHVKDVFIMKNETQGRLMTRRPVKKVDKFRTSGRSDIDSDVTLCYCEDNIPDIIPACCGCECTIPCQPLLLDHIAPQNKLCPGQYQISGSEIDGMGGYDGRIMKVNTGRPVEALWVTYHRGPKHIKNIDEVIPLPNSYIHILALIMASYVIPHQGINMQQQDLSRMSMARKELDYLKKADNVFPKKFITEPDVELNIF